MSSGSAFGRSSLVSRDGDLGLRYGMSPLGSNPSGSRLGFADALSRAGKAVQDSRRLHRPERNRPYRRGSSRGDGGGGSELRSAFGRSSLVSRDGDLGLRYGMSPLGSNPSGSRLGFADALSRAAVQDSRRLHRPERNRPYRRGSSRGDGGGGSRTRVRE